MQNKTAIPIALHKNKNLKIIAFSPKQLSICSKNIIINI